MTRYKNYIPFILLVVGIVMILQSGFVPNFTSNYVAIGVSLSMAYIVFVYVNHRDKAVSRTWNDARFVQRIMSYLVVIIGNIVLLFLMTIVLSNYILNAKTDFLRVIIIPVICTAYTFAFCFLWKHLFAKQIFQARIHLGEYICPNCGYPRSKEIGVCAECGYVFSSASGSKTPS